MTAEMELFPPRLRRAPYRTAATLPAIGGIDVGACCLPAAGRHAVGGDFHDVFRVDGDRWAVLLGDACGSDAHAARLATLTRALVRATVTPSRAPAAVLAEVNAALRLEAARSGEVDAPFATAVLAYASADDRGVDVRLASAGHVPPLLVRQTGWEEPRVHGSLLGVLEDVSFEPCSIRLEAGDALVLCTDGVTEARDTAGTFFGDGDLAASLQRSWGRNAGAVAERIQCAVLNHAGGTTSDDIAVLVVAAPRP